MESNASANIEYYDKMSRVYDQKHQIDMKDFALFRRQIKKLLAPKYIKHGSKVLDCGCGTGRGALKFCKLGCDVFAVDISPDITQKCHDNGIKFGYDIHTQPEDCRKLTFKDNTFDYVSTSAALHHMEDLEQCLQEFYRVTKPGGALLLIGEPKVSKIRPDWIREKKEALSAAYDLKVAGIQGMKVNPDVYIFDLKRLKKCLKDAGFTNIHVQSFFFLSSLYRDLLYFRIYNQKLRGLLLSLTRFLDTYLFFWLPSKYYALFNLVAWKEEIEK